MGLISDLISEKRSTSNLKNPRQWLTDMFRRPSHSGVNVTEHNASTQSVVWRATTFLSGQIASLPLNTYRHINPRGKEKARDHQVFSLLHDRPNPYQTSFEWRLAGIHHQLFWGNWYSWIEREGGRPVALWLLPPWKVEPFRDGDNQLWYDIELPTGEQSRQPFYNILHIKNLFHKSVDKGMGCVEAAREAIGLGLAIEEFGARFFGQGTNVGGMVEHPGELNKDAFDRLKGQIDEKYSGLGKSHRVMLLEEGMQFKQVGIPPDQAQFLESKKFQTSEIGRFFFVTQLHKLGDLDKATFSNIEHQSIEFLTDTLLPLLKNIEQQVNTKLFRVADDEDHFVEFVVDGLLRGDTESRYRAYATARQWGFMSANDIRELENMNPLPENQGDVYLSPMNMVPADQLLNPENLRKHLPELEERETPAKEFRRGGANERHRTIKSYKRVFEDAIARVIKREQSDIKRQASNLLNNRNLTAFEDWLSEFYDNHKEFTRRNMLPPFTSLAEVAHESVADELSKRLENKEQIDRFIDEYMTAFVARYVGINESNLRKAIDKARDEGREELEAIEQELDRWDDFRAQDVARNETVKLGNAVVRTAFAAYGVERLVWRNTGGSPCEFCEELDGKVVGINEPFVADGDSIESENSNMRVTGPKYHPPAHRGCVCDIEAE